MWLSFQFEVVDPLSSEESVAYGAINMCRKIKQNRATVLSARLFAPNNDRIIDVYSSCSVADMEHYSASIYPLDGCVNIYNFPKVRLSVNQQSEKAIWSSVLFCLLLRGIAIVGSSQVRGFEPANSTNITSRIDRPI